MVNYVFTHSSFQAQVFRAQELSLLVILTIRQCSEGRVLMNGLQAAKQLVVGAARRGHSLKHRLEGPAIQLLIDLMSIEIHSNKTEKVHVNHLTGAHPADHVGQKSRDPLRGGSRDKEAGETPHGHRHWRPLSEVGQRQKHPVSHHGGLPCGMQGLENLVDHIGHELRVGLLIGQELSDDLVHDILRRKEVIQKLGQNPRYHSSLAG